MKHRTRPVRSARALWHPDATIRGVAVACCTRLLADLGLQGKSVRTTDADKAAAYPQDHVNLQFHAPAPNMLWFSDFTIVSTLSGFIYVAFVIDASSAGASPERRMQASCSTRWNKRFTNGDQHVVAWCTIPTGVRNTSVFDTPSALLRRASSLPSAASATATTMRTPKRSMGSTRLRSSKDVDLGGVSKPSSSRR